MIQTPVEESDFIHTVVYKYTLLQLEKYSVLHSMTTELQDIFNSSEKLPYLEFPTRRTVPFP